MPFGSLLRPPLTSQMATRFAQPFTTRFSTSTISEPCVYYFVCPIVSAPRLGGYLARCPPRLRRFCSASYLFNYIPHDFHYYSSCVASSTQHESVMTIDTAVDTTLYRIRYVVCKM